MSNKKDLDSKENLGHGIKGEQFDDTAKLKSSKNSTKNSSNNEKSNMDELL